MDIHIHVFMLRFSVYYEFHRRVQDENERRKMREKKRNEEKEHRKEKERLENICASED